MDYGLSDRVVLVTGGSGAIGAASAAAFAREGANVVVGWFRSEQRAEEVVAEIRQAGGVATAVQLDQGDPHSVQQVVARIAVEQGGIDVLVSNAVSWPTQDAGWDALMRELAVNLAGASALAEAVLPGMRSRGWGRVIFVSSDVVDQPVVAGAAGYPAAKAGIEAVARLLAVREASEGVLTNVVRPGFTLTERARARAAAVESESAKTPTRRICTPEDVASAIVYLGSNAQRHINGEVLSVSGGRQLTR